MVVWTGDIGPKFLAAVLTSPNQRLILSSPGGCVYSMLGAIDQLRKDDATGYPWTIQGTGIIASAAIPILAAGGEGRRACTPRTRFMAHAGGLILSGTGSAKSLETDAEQLKLLDDQYCEMLGEWTKVPASKWKSLCSEGEHWFGAKEALRLGLVDAILP